MSKLAASSLQAALGSGPFIRAGLGLNGMSGTDLYMIPTENRYREIAADSLMIYYKDFAGSEGFLRPVLVVGWEQSFNPVLSISGGLGPVFSGAVWKGNPVHNKWEKSSPSPPLMRC